MGQKVSSAFQNTESLCEEVLISLRKIMQSIYLHSHYLSRHFGLTGPQLLILQQLSKMGKVHIGEISKAISLSQATVTGILDRLEKRGLIERSRTSDDKRKVFIDLTPECRELLDKAPPPIQESFLENFKNLNDWEQTMILSSLQRLVLLMDAKSIQAAPILSTEPIGENADKNINS